MSAAPAVSGDDLVTEPSVVAEDGELLWFLGTLARIKLDGRRTGSEPLVQPGSQRGGRGVGVVEHAAPYARPILVLLPVPSWLEACIQIGAAIARDSGAAPSFERQRLHHFDAVATAKREGPRVSRRTYRIGP